MTKLVTSDQLRFAIEDGSVIVVGALPAAPYSRRHIPGNLNLVIDDVDEQAPQLIAGVWCQPRRILHGRQLWSTASAVRPWVKRPPPGSRAISPDSTTTTAPAMAGRRRSASSESPSAACT